MVCGHYGEIAGLPNKRKWPMVCGHGVEFKESKFENIWSSTTLPKEAVNVRTQMGFKPHEIVN
jgi:hypothetical protein